MSLTPAQVTFLKNAYQGAQDAHHVYPAMAACEAALESSWGTSELATKGNNLFGQKQQVHPIFGSIDIPTREFLNRAWVTQNATWVVFPSLSDCFASRMATLERLAPDYPHYALALEASTPEEYVTEVSLSWSTDPNRATNCIEIYHGQPGRYETLGRLTELREHTMKRRQFLGAAGTVTVLALGGGFWRAYDDGVFTPGEGPAFRPWDDWTENAGQPLALVRAAILAANPHNTQPWLFRVKQNSIEIYANTIRNGGALDPYLREQFIGIGCALENMMLAAPVNGYTAMLSVTSETAPMITDEPKVQHLATVQLVSGQRQTRNDLYEAIPRRHTNRNPFSPAEVSSEFLETLRTIGTTQPDIRLFLFPAEHDRDRIARMILRANDIVYSDPVVSRGSNRWIRRRWSDVQRYRDGLVLDEFGQPPLTTAAEKFLPAKWARVAIKHDLLQTTSYSGFLESVPLFGIIAVRNRYDRAQSLQAGRIWQRAHLAATAKGLAGRPANEVIELTDHQKLRGQAPIADADLAALIRGDAWQPTFMFCFGHPIREVPPSPRRPVEEVLL